VDAAPTDATARDRHRTLLQISNALVSNLTREALFRAIAWALRSAVRFERTAVFLHDADRDVLRLLLLESVLPSTYFEVGLEFPVGDSHVGRVFREQRSLLRRDLARERQYPPEDRALADGVRSYVIVPLVVRGRSIGVLAVASTVPDGYTDADAEFLREVASQVALAVENMQAYEQITALNATLSATASRHRTLLEINNAIVVNLERPALFEAVSRALQRVIPFDRSTLFLHDPDRDVLRLFHLASDTPSDMFVVGLELPVADTHVGWVLTTRTPLLRRDLERERHWATEDRLLAEGFRSTLVVPLAARGRCVGTLNVGSRTPGRYTEADAAFMQEVAGQVALAVLNMTVYEEVTALKARLEHENVYLQEEIHRDHNFADMVGTSPALLAVLERVAQVAPTDATVLITGETGTGKELIARALHKQSPRRDRPLVKVDCAAISAGLVESELFGHVKGAFTGALDRRVGRFELADGGTIFLDEVGELPPETQVKLLRVLQEREFQPVGSNRTVRVDVRVIAATNRNLEEAVAAGRFRADLYYRLDVFPLVVPPLRERRADVPQLVMYFAGQFAARQGKRITSVSEEAMRQLVAYDWPGNVRELQNLVERAVVLARGPELVLEAGLLRGALEPTPAAAARPASPPAEPEDAGLDAALEDAERRAIQAALARSGGVIEGPRGAARLLKLHPNTLRSRMEKLGIRRGGHETS
jgi:formate hydrogenlyase transcriptional activator